MSRCLAAILPVPTKRFLRTALNFLLSDLRGDSSARTNKKYAGSRPNFYSVVTSSLLTFWWVVEARGVAQFGPSPFDACTLPFSTEVDFGATLVGGDGPTLVDFGATLTLPTHLGAAQFIADTRIFRQIPMREVQNPQFGRSPTSSVLCKSGRYPHGP